MATPIEAARARLRLLQLVSPQLPVGAYSFSQGLEWAAECGWIDSAAALEAWLTGQARRVAVVTDLPLLARLYRAAASGDAARFAALDAEWLAWRETAELRAEERHKGRALATLLHALEPAAAHAFLAGLEASFLAAFAWAAAHWHVPLRDAAEGYLWGWLENQVIAAVKLVPLGQTAGQAVLHRLAGEIPGWVAGGLAVDDPDLGGSAQALALASARHETQYSRLYRS